MVQYHRGGDRVKQMRCHGFEVKENRNGSYSVVLRGKDEMVFQVKGVSFNEAGEWVWNMADNHDIASVVNVKMCKVFGKSFFKILWGY